MKRIRIVAAVCAVAVCGALLMTTVSAADAPSGASSAQNSAASSAGSGASVSAAKAASGGSSSSAVSAASGTSSGTVSGGSSSGVSSGAAGSNSQAGTAAQPAIDIRGKAAVLAEASTGQILYQNNPHEKLYPASITKIMTELLVLEAIEGGKLSLDDKVTASPHASSMGGSDIWLEPGEVMTVNELFKAMAVSSANDAAVALAEKVAGSEQAFVSMMNEKAKELGMNDTTFVNCTGLDDTDANVTSAYDVMLMSRALVQHPNIFNYCSIWMDTLRDGKTNLYNTNKLIHSYEGANGLKTGSTGKAGYCLSATAKRDGMQLIAVVMNCQNVKDRFTSAANMLDYGFANYASVTPDTGTAGLRVKVLHGQKDSVAAKADSGASLLVPKGKEKSVRREIASAPNVMAPVVKGQVVGEISYWIGSQKVGTVSLRAGEAVGVMTFGNALARLFSHIV